MFEILGTTLEDGEAAKCTGIYSHIKPKPLLMQRHSLEIPGLESDNAPPVDDLMLDSVVDCDSVTSGFVQGNSVQDDEFCDLISAEVVKTSADELDKILAGLLEPEILPNQPVNGLPRSDRPHRHKRRISRKEKIRDLLNMVSELSQKLQDLRAVPSNTSGVVSRQVSSPTMRPQSLWEHIASGQFKLQRKAEEENAKLKDLMASQRRMVRNFRRMIRRRTDNEFLEEPRPKLVINEQAFGKLVHGIDDIYVNLNKFYDEKDISSVPCPGRKRLVYPDAANGTTFVEFIDKNLVPFSFDKAERAVWEFLQGPRVRHRGRVRSKAFQQTADTCKSCVSFTSSVRGLSTYVLEHRVARKYVEDKRTVFITRMTAVPTITNESWASDLRFKETMSVVVRTDSSLSTGQMTTIIESHLSVSMYTEDCDPVVEQHWHDYVNLAASGWDRMISFNSQEIENLLFKHSLDASNVERNVRQGCSHELASMI